jgi:hypothetical protein
MRRVARAADADSPTMGDRGRLGGAGSRAAIADTGSGVPVIKWPWGVAGVLAAIATAAFRYEPAVPAAPVAPAAVPHATLTEQEREEDTAALLHTGAEGVFVLSVTGVHCGVDAVGPVQRAHGTFCLVGIAVENAGQEARLLDDGAQRAVDTRGRAYAVAGRAAAVLNDRPPTLLRRIAPGSTVRGVLPFDVPRGTRLSALILHDTPGSRGARVPLA